MAINLNVQEQRAKAIAILKDAQGGSDYQPVDYVIDDECRRLLKLPPRPANSQPYIGWMIGSSKTTAPIGKLSKEGVEHIAQYEGCRLAAYQCPRGVWTIGYGHTIGVRSGMVITKDQAIKLFSQDLQKFQVVVRNLVLVPLNQGQFDTFENWYYKSL